MPEGLKITEKEEDRWFVSFTYTSPEGKTIIKKLFLKDQSDILKLDDIIGTLLAAEGIEYHIEEEIIGEEK